MVEKRKRCETDRAGPKGHLMELVDSSTPPTAWAIGEQLMRRLHARWLIRPVRTDRVLRELLACRWQHTSSDPVLLVVV